MKVVYIKLLSLFILSFSILCGTEFNTYNDIKNNIAEIRQEFNEYDDNEKLDDIYNNMQDYISKQKLASKQIIGTIFIDDEK